MLGVYVAGCSGAHLNPAITLANCIFRGFPWKKLPAYAFAQVLGCFCGAVGLCRRRRRWLAECSSSLGCHLWEL